MNKISCDICWDLIPLVQDNVASEASRIAVMEHIQRCDSCNNVFNDINFKEPQMNNAHVLSKIKRRLSFAAILIIVLGAMVGIGISNGMTMFYNVLIMPTIGALGYLALRGKSYYVPLMLFIFVYLYHLITYIGEGMLSYNTLISTIILPGYLALIYSGLCYLGIIIAFLLKIAFRKEGKYEKYN